MNDFDVPDVGVLGNGDVEMVANLEGGGGFECFLAALNFSGLAGFGCQGACLVEAHGPEPFVESAAVGHGGVLRDRMSKSEGAFVS